jgi:hypothetical protein
VASGERGRANGATSTLRANRQVKLKGDEWPGPTSEKRSSVTAHQGRPLSLGPFPAQLERTLRHYGRPLAPFPAQLERTLRHSSGIINKLSGVTLG